MSSSSPWEEDDQDENNTAPRKDLDVFLDGVPEEVVTLGKRGKKIAAKATKLGNFVEGLVDHLRTSALVKPENIQSYDDILGGDFIDLLSRVAEKIRKYQEWDPDPVEIDRDILTLGVLLVELNAVAGYQEGKATHAEGSYKLVMDRYIIEAKKYCQESKESCPEFVLKAVARDEAEGMRVMWSNHLALAGALKGYYFASRQLLEIMDHTAGRMRQDRALDVRS